MISEKNAKMFCKEDISKIENYNKAIADTIQTWHCHHRDEVKVLPSGMIVYRSRQELKENGRYYNCPANELIFLTPTEHQRLHKNGKNRSDKTRQKISKAKKGKTYKKGKTTTIFGKSFQKHYGITCSDNLKLYKKEYSFYKRHGKFSWEIK